MSGFFKALKQRRISAQSLYQTALSQSRRPIFYTKQGVPDSVTGRFEMTVLHSFLVWNRLRGEGKVGEKLAQGVFDAMFVDMERSLRLIGIGDLSVPRHMKRMMKGFKGRALAYRDGLENPDDPDVLLLAIQRNLFGTVPTPSDEKLRWFAHYIRQNAALLARQPWADLETGLIVFESVDDEQEIFHHPLDPRMAA